MSLIRHTPPVRRSVTPEARSLVAPAGSVAVVVSSRPNVSTPAESPDREVSAIFWMTACCTVLVLPAVSASARSASS